MSEPASNIHNLNEPDDTEDTDATGVTLATEDQKTIETIQQFVENQSRRADERKSLNNQIQSDFEALQAKGIPKKIARFCMKLNEMTPDELRQADIAMYVFRNAIGKPRNLDLFQDGETE